MLIEAAKGGHTNVVSYLLDYPNNILSVPAPDLSQLTPPSQDASQVKQWRFLGSLISCISPRIFVLIAKKIKHFLHRNRFLVYHSKLSPW